MNPAHLLSIASASSLVKVLEKIQSDINYTHFAGSCVFLIRNSIHSSAMRYVNLIVTR